MYNVVQQAPRDSGSTGEFAKGWPTKEEIESELGGYEGWFLMWGRKFGELAEHPNRAH